MRTALKGLVESALLAGGPAAFSRRRYRHRSLILAYHNILPTGAAPGGDFSLHLPLNVFRGQLDLLERTCNVVPLADILRHEESGRPRVAITFDDAYEGAVSDGVRELERRQLPATVFVTPGLLGGHAFWWDTVRDLPNGGLQAATREYALWNCRGEDDVVQAWARKVGKVVGQAGSSAVASSESSLRDAMRHSGLTLGSHTWTHPNLSLIPSDQLASELRRPLEWLHERFDRVIDWISYPYGLTSLEVEAAAQRAGYQGGLLVQGGWLHPSSHSRPLRLPRFNVPAGLSAKGFALRLAGMFTH